MNKVDKLIEEYNSLIQRDHHKDRDCHFTIEKSWDYGEFSGWRVSHYGYCHKENDLGMSKDFSTYDAAENHLILLLIQWIKDEKEPFVTVALP